MRYLKFKQVKKTEVEVNTPFYLVDPDQNENAKVYYSVDDSRLAAYDKVWVAYDVRDTALPAR